VRRSELQTLIGHYLDGLVSGVERKTGWLLAERAGDARPRHLEAVLGRGRWDADAAPDLMQTYPAEALADPDAVLVVDGIGFLKRSVHSVGMARQ
jgi:SRSO17 transposase